MATGKFKPAAMYGISMSGGGTAGWKVELKRKGVTLSKTFCFSTCGGEDAALRRAQAWRDEMIKKHPPTSRQQRANNLRRNNKSGTPGVTCHVGSNGKPKGWIAGTYLSPGNKLTKYFSVSRYGLEAKLLVRQHVNNGT